MHRLSSHLPLALLVSFLLAACAGPRSSPSLGSIFSPSTTPPSGGGEDDGAPIIGTYKIGKPYQIAGVWYYPQEDFDYDETGIASWYGPGFHRRRTANGERYDQNELTAAHRTLPMPSLVQVTNLDNGRAIIARVNDRGPFSRGRIIDLSRKSAELLGMLRSGTARVRVQILPQESRALAQAALARDPGAQQNPLPRLVANRPSPPPDQKSSPQQKRQNKKVLADNNAGQIQQPPPAAVKSVNKNKPAHIEVRRNILTPLPGTVAAAERLPKALPGGQESINTIPGHLDPQGLFRPDPIVRQTTAKIGAQSLFVQVGAFGAIDNARRLKERLTELGPVELTPITLGRTRYYRVRIGPLASVAAADAALAKLLNLGLQESRIVVDQKK
jgi:rare lipoprotein A